MPWRWVGYEGDLESGAGDGWGGGISLVVIHGGLAKIGVPYKRFCDR